MSAFNDIWIGTTPPQFVRLSNSAWEPGKTMPNCWLSLPSAKPAAFLNRFSANDYEVLVLGQFYEPVNNQKLLSQCTGYIKNPAIGFNDPAGHYIIFLYDTVQKRYHVFTNRHGTYHAYWLEEGGRSAISTSFLALARHSEKKELDWEGLTGFLGMGFFPADKTYLQNIKIFRPASYYSFDEHLQLLTSRRYWNWVHHVSGTSVKDFLPQLDAVMNDSLSCALNGYKVASPISGGLDSRMLAGIITRNASYESVWGYSYGYTKNSVEISIADKIAKARSIPFDAYIVPDYLFNRLDVISESTDLFQYVDGTRQACMQEALEQNSDVVIGGHWGDVWMDGMGIDALEADGGKDGALRAAFKKKIIKKGSNWLLTEICDNYLPGSHNYLFNYFDDAIDKYNHLEDTDFRFKAYKTDEWSFRWTLASIRMYQAAVFPVLPFYDKNVSGLFLQVPTQLVKGRELQIEYLKQYHPDLAKITWQEYGRNLYSYKGLNNRNIIYRAVKKLERTIKNEKPVMRNWEIFYLNPKGRANLEAHLLNNKMLNDITGTEKIKQLLDRFYNDPSGGNGYAISMMLTFSQALNKIFG